MIRSSTKKVISLPQCVANGDESPISVNDLFHNGQMKSMYLMFDHSLLLSANSKVDLPCRLSVKVFVEAKDFSPPAAEGGEEGAVEMFCALLRKAVEASLEICKKSNSTKFFKLFIMSGIQRGRVRRRNGVSLSLDLGNGNGEV